MPFTAHDLRYNLESTYPALCAYLQQHAKRYLGHFAYDAYEVDVVVGHVVEQLTRLGILGGGNHTPETALDHLSNAQFYAFLNQSIKNKAIDRLRRKRLSTTTLGELEESGNSEEEIDPLNTVAASIWGSPPFPTPEAAALQTVNQEELRTLLKHCIEMLSSAPRQLQAIMLELNELGAEALLGELQERFRAQLANLELSHLSQNKDHAHKKLRYCLQKSSTNLAVLVALRLTKYSELSTDTGIVSVEIQSLATDGLSEWEVRKGLTHLVKEDLLQWHGEEVVRFSSAQLKRLERFYEEEE